MRMNPGQTLVIWLIQAYRLVVSPAQRALFGPGAGCRYTPTCSEYAREAVGIHGVGKGTVLAGQRLLRCHPWGGCGCDPVPGLVDQPNMDNVRSASKGVS